MSVTVRPMQVGDVEAVHSSGTTVEAFQTSRKEGAESPFWPKERLYKWVETGEDVLLVAEENGTIIGYFLSHLHQTTGAAYIENLYVDEEYRRQGIGERLLEEGVDRIIERGGQYISALTKTDNEPMRNLLQKVGFNTGDTFVWMDRIER